MKVDECIGCGYCCRKAPCSISFLDGYWIDSKCSVLRWDGKKWRCGWYEKFKTDEEKKKIENCLYIGAGCCSNLNTYQLAQYVPTPEDLKDEDTLTRRLDQTPKSRGAFFRRFVN